MVVFGAYLRRVAQLESDVVDSVTIRRYSAQLSLHFIFVSLEGRVYEGRVRS